VKHFLLTYTLAPDYLERRPAFRGAHLALAQAAAARGELLLGGALDPPEEAVLLFAGEDALRRRGLCGERSLRGQRPCHRLARARLDDSGRQGGVKPGLT
jgi:hypothetical protein